jgi:hypothetical protein
MASGISFIGMTSANASAPSLLTVSNITSSGATADISAFTATNPQFAIDVRVFAATGATTSVAALQTIQVDNNSVTTVPVTGLTSGTAYRLGLVNRSTNFVYELDSFTTSGSAPAVNLGLSTSSTIKGASISSLGVGNIDPLSVTRGSVTLTSTQAANVSNSGSFVTAFSAVSGSAEIAAINKYARGVTPFYVGGPTSLNIYNGTAALSDGDFFQVVVASISNGGNYLWYIIEVTVTAGGGSTPAPTTPTPTAAEIAAAAAAAAKAAEEAAAIARAAEIAKAQNALATVLKGDKAGTLSEYRSANIYITTAASLARINAEVLKLSANDRSDFSKIKAIADKIEFDESFFNATARPTLSTYAKYEVVGITERTLPTVNAKVLELPAAKRIDAAAIKEIVKVESFVDLVANTTTRESVTSTRLIEKGLLPADTPYKHSVRSGLASYPEGSLNSMAKIEAAIKAELEKAGARKAKTAEIRARIAARNK